MHNQVYWSAPIACWWRSVKHRLNGTRLLCRKKVTFSEVLRQLNTNCKVNKRPFIMSPNGLDVTCSWSYQHLFVSVWGHMNSRRAPQQGDRLSNIHQAASARHPPSRQLVPAVAAVDVLSRQTHPRCHMIKHMQGKSDWWRERAGGREGGCREGERRGEVEGEEWVWPWHKSLSGIAISQSTWSGAREEREGGRCEGGRGGKVHQWMTFKNCCPSSEVYMELKKSSWET